MTFISNKSFAMFAYPLSIYGIRIEVLLNLYPLFLTLEPYSYDGQNITRNWLFFGSIHQDPKIILKQMI